MKARKVLLSFAISLCLAGVAQAGEIDGLGTPEALPDRYIVILRDKPGVSADVRVQALGKKYGAQVDQVYSHLFHGAAVKLDMNSALRMADDPDIAWIEVDRPAKPDAQVGATWGLDRIDQSGLPLDGKYSYPAGAAAGVNVYVIDLPVRATHSEFRGRMGQIASFQPPNDPREPTPVPGDPVPSPQEADQRIHHGTHVAGTIAGSTYGVAKGATIHSLRVFNDQFHTTEASLLASLDWLRANVRYPAVANMSLTLGVPADAVDMAVERLTQANIVVVVGAGNDGSDTCFASPARAPSAITVGATDANDVHTSFSNHGPCVDIWAPGVNITSAGFLGDNEALEMSGTSMAAPHVAGAAALALANNPWASPGQVRQMLVSLANPNGILDTSYFVDKPSTYPRGLTTTSNHCYNENRVKWDQQPEATYYQLWASRSQSFSSPVLWGTYVDTETTEDFEPRRYLEIRGCNTRGCGPLSPVPVVTKTWSGCGN